MDARILTTYSEPITTPQGRAYVARVRGRMNADRRWEAWIEFIPTGGTPVVRTGRETHQPHLKALEHWAESLGRIYFEGALERSMNRERRRPAGPLDPINDRRAFDRGPRPGDALPGELGQDHPQAHAIFANPLLDYDGDEQALRRKLDYLATAELRAMARAYHFGGNRGDVRTLDRDALIERIVAEARHRSA